MSQEDFTDLRNEAAETGRLMSGNVDRPDVERCFECDELLHPYPPSTEWMDQPLPTCCLVDGAFKLCDDDRKPECLSTYLARAVRYAATKKTASKNDLQRWDRRNRTAALMHLANGMPEAKADQQRKAKYILECFHAAVMGAARPQAEHQALLLDALVWKMSKGLRSNEQRRQLFVKFAAKPGYVPAWGQSGDFLITVNGVRARVEFDCQLIGMMNPHFQFHIIDFDRPFISETGYKSFFYNLELKIIAKKTVAQVAETIFFDLLSETPRKKACIEEASATRLQKDPLPAWLAKLSPAPCRLTKAQRDALAVPKGYEQVDVVVTAHQAFQIRKWAEAAQAKIAALADQATKAQPSRHTIGDFKVGTKARVIHSGRFPIPDQDVGKIIVVTKVIPEEPDLHCVRAYIDRPMTYKTNRKGQKVVDFDPSYCQGFYQITELEIIN